VTVVPGLETVAADEIKRSLCGEVRKTAAGVVVFRVPEIDPALLDLRTTEDVFLHAWGADHLTYRAQDLDSIRRWTAREPDWANLLRIHHAIRPKPKGKPTFRLVTQMNGTHGYRRIDAREALAEGLSGHIPPSWRHAEENAAVEIWLTIDERQAVCGIRLSDRTMRHRKYKMEHLRASLRPTVAAAMVRLSDTKRNQLVLDPMCGAGTILAEQLDAARRLGGARIQLWGGDLDASALRAAGANLRRLGHVCLARWNATRLPLASASVDRVISNPPFGKQLSTPGQVGPLYRRMIREYDRVLRSEGQAVLLVGDFRPLRDAVERVGWKLMEQIRVRILGQPAALTVWRKPGQYSSIQPNPTPGAS
jgi:tRNA (guanine6-N2)-methyltransferase